MLKQHLSTRLLMVLLSIQENLRMDCLYNSHFHLCWIALLLCGLQPSNLGIISPYRAQLKLIRSMLSKINHATGDAIEIHTVDKYQVYLSIMFHFFNLLSFPRWWGCSNFTKNTGEVRYKSRALDSSMAFRAHGTSSPRPLKSLYHIYKSINQSLSLSLKSTSTAKAP